MKKQNSQRRALLLTLVFFSSVHFLHASVAPSSIDVRWTNSSMAVRIAQPSNLYLVLDSMCKATHYDCQLPQQAEATMVAPASLAGAWNDVLGRLMAGTGFDYVLMLSDKNGESGKLIVMTASPMNQDSARPNQTVASGPPDNSATIYSAETPAASEFSEPQPVSASASTGSSELNGMMTPPSFAGSQEGQVAAQDAVIRNLSEVSKGAGSGSYGVMPFPDGKGNAVPVPQGREYPAVMMFPDGQGHAVPIPSGPSQNDVMVFPDGHGNAVPVPHHQ